MKWKVFILIIFLVLGLVGASVFLLEREVDIKTTEPESLNSINSLGLTEKGESQIKFSIYKENPQWVVLDSTGDYRIYFENASDKKTHIGWYLDYFITPNATNTEDKYIYNCNGEKLLDDKDKEILLKYESNKVPCLLGMCDGYFIALTDAKSVNINECIRLNPTIVYQNQSKVVFEDGETQVNNTLKKWNGEEFVIAPEEVWIREVDGNNYKFGANDTISKKNTLYQYEWNSNKEIKYDSKRKYYYFDTMLSEMNQISNVYTRKILNTDDICDIKCIQNGEGECLEEFNPECSFNLNGNNLIVNFTGYYDSEDDVIFIDPSYSFTNYSTSATGNYQTRPESSFGHLELSDNHLLIYHPFDVNTGSVFDDYSNNDLDATTYNQAQYTASGKFEGGIVFDGTDDYISIGYGDGVNPSAIPHTYSLWVKTDSTSSTPSILVQSKGTSARTYFGIYNTRWTMGIGTSSYTSTSGTIATTDWHMMTVVMDGSDATMYIDGSDISYTKSYSFSAFDQDLDIGDYAGQTSFDGTIDDVMVFNRSLSTTEIEQLYNSTFSKYYNSGNQTFEMMNVSLGSDNTLNLTVETSTLNDTSLKARVYEANYSNYNTTDLVLYFRFDNLSAYGESTTNVYDFSGNNNNASNNGNAVIDIDGGRYNGGALFDGTNDYYQVADDDTLDFTSEMTISFWANADTWSGTNDLVKKDGNFIFRRDAGDGSPGTGIKLYWFDGTNLKRMLGYDISTTQWHHITGVVTGNDISALYIDGEEVGGSSDTITPVGRTLTNVLTIGDQSGGGESFDGHIDNLMIFDRALSEVEVNNLYATQSVNHRNKGTGIIWSESSSGTQSLSTVNATHENATFTINSASDFLSVELEYLGTDETFTPLAKKLMMDTYYVEPVSEANCTCPTDENWEIDLTGNCVISDTCDLTGYNITFTNTGTITFNATIKACDIGDLPNSQRGYLGDLAKVYVGEC